MIVLTFDLEGTVLSTCDRCLDPFQLPINDAQQLLIKYGLEEKEEAEVAYILKGTPELNVARYVYEYICLAVPISKYCTDSDDKDCNEEMTQYLDSDSSTEEKANNPIWDALKDIKKK